MKRKLAAAATAVALVLGGGLWVSTGSAASAGDGAARGWAGSRTWTAADERAAASRGDKGGRTLVVFARQVRAAVIDVGQRGFSSGDYEVFEDALFNARGKRIGGGSARCMVMVRTFRCDGTNRIWGVGKIEIAGSSFTDRDNRFSITGGTGRYRGAGGTMRAFGVPEGTRLEFHFAC